MLTFPPDISFVVQVVSLLVLWFGLKRLIFDPTQSVLEERAARTSGARQAAAETRASADRRAAEYEAQIAATRQAVARETDAFHKQTQDVAADRSVLQSKPSDGVCFSSATRALMSLRMLTVLYGKRKGFLRTMWL